MHKNIMHTSINKDRPYHLARMISESEILRKLDFHNVTENFVKIISRKTSGF